MEAAARRAGRSPDEVRLVVVSKGHGPDEILRLYQLGQRDFGENRAQDLRDKAPQLPGDIRWHFVGHLQTNKVRMVRPAVVLLHSLDRPELAAAWMKGPGMPPPALLQVNVAGEPQKHGVHPDDAEEVAAELVAMGVPLQGVMTIPPLSEDAEESRRHFRRLREVRNRLAARFPSVRELSMGMSDDFEVAVEEGATFIRVGRAIFLP